MFILFKNISIALLSSWYMFHPVHVSVTNVDYVVDKNKIEFSTKIFKKDFKLLLYHLYEIQADFEKDTVSQKNRNLMEEYFSSHFKLTLDSDVNAELIFDNILIKDEYIWFYYKINVEEKIHRMEIINTLLFDLYFDQKNMLIYGYNQLEEGYLFNIQQTKHTIELDEF